MHQFMSLPADVVHTRSHSPDNSHPPEKSSGCCRTRPTRSFPCRAGDSPAPLAKIRVSSCPNHLLKRRRMVSGSFFDVRISWTWSGPHAPVWWVHPPRSQIAGSSDSTVCICGRMKRMGGNFRSDFSRSQRCSSYPRTGSPYWLCLRSTVFRGSPWRRVP